MAVESSTAAVILLPGRLTCSDTQIPNRSSCLLSYHGPVHPLIRPAVALGIAMAFSVLFGIWEDHCAFAGMRRLQALGSESLASRSVAPVPKRSVSSLGIHPTSHRMTLTTTKTVLGRTALVGLTSMNGLCVEVDHIYPKSHAGACSFNPLPNDRPLLAVSIGFSSGLGQSGVTELVGMAGPAVRFVQVSYASDTGRRHLSVPVGELPRSIVRRTKVPARRWFAIDAPGCLESHDLRMHAYGSHRSFLGSATGLDQYAACQAGIGYKSKGAVIYGSLPPS
jgi:hypothetical protein